MILCPKCNTRTNVYDSRISFEGQTRRKRICPSCDHRFATIEILDKGRVLNERKQAAPKPKKEKLPRAIKKPAPKRIKVEKSKRYDEDDFYEDPLAEDFREVARELGIGGYE